MFGATKAVHWHCSWCCLFCANSPENEGILRELACSLIDSRITCRERYWSLDCLAGVKSMYQTQESAAEAIKPQAAEDVRIAMANTSLRM
jgi:hypothetical protein